MEQPTSHDKDMQHRIHFSLALRILGAYELTQALYYVVTCLNVATNHYKPAATSAGAFALHAVADVLFGIYLLKGAPWLVDFAFRPKPPKISEVIQDNTSGES